jgi:hypothetical protein
MVKVSFNGTPQKERTTLSAVRMWMGRLWMVRAAGGPDTLRSA